MSSTNGTSNESTDYIPKNIFKMIGSPALLTNAEHTTHTLSAYRTHT